MAVIVEAWAVIARRTTVESTLVGGLERWRALVPNQVHCADRHLCCVGFMHEHDATTFMRLLEAEGLEGERGGSYRDVAIISPEGPWHHDCNWLESGRYAGIDAVWLRAADPEPLVVPVYHRVTGTIINFSPEQASERLEFLRTEGNVDVFWDKQTQRELYRGRIEPQPAPQSADEQTFQDLIQRLDGLLSFDITPIKLGWLQRRRLRKGIDALERLTERVEEPWRVWFMLGVARRSLPDPEGAWQAFRAAYHDNPVHRDVAREYAGQCLVLGRGREAVELGRRSCERWPDNAALRSNLALALMVAGDMDGAKAEVTRAREMEPDDPITATLERMIDEVRRGERPRPTRYP